MPMCVYTSMKMEKPAFVCQTHIYTLTLRGYTTAPLYNHGTRNTFVIPGRKIGAEYKCDVYTNATSIYRYRYGGVRRKRRAHRLKAITTPIDIATCTFRWNRTSERTNERTHHKQTRTPSNVTKNRMIERKREWKKESHRDEYTTGETSIKAILKSKILYKAQYSTSQQYFLHLCRPMELSMCVVIVCFSGFGCAFGIPYRLCSQCCVCVFQCKRTPLFVSSNSFFLTRFAFVCEWWVCMLVYVMSESIRK